MDLFFFKPSLDAYKAEDQVVKMELVTSMSNRSLCEYVTWSLARANVHPNVDSVNGSVIWGALAIRQAIELVRDVEKL